MNKLHMTHEEKKARNINCPHKQQHKNSNNNLTNWISWKVKTSLKCDLEIPPSALMMPSHSHSE